ncbi:overexpressed in colon carcinoma 1 protein isoform X6 [Lissotriton helveticus]
MGCGKSVATSQPGAGTTDAAKDITEESPTEDHQKRAGRRKVEVKSFAECPPNKHQLSSKTTISVRRVESECFAIRQKARYKIGQPYQGT